jgi:hypothetical protein
MKYVSYCVNKEVVEESRWFKSRDRNRIELVYEKDDGSGLVLVGTMPYTADTLSLQTYRNHALGKATRQAFLVPGSAFSIGEIKPVVFKRPRRQPSAVGLSVVPRPGL